MVFSSLAASCCRGAEKPLIPVVEISGTTSNINAYSDYATRYLNAEGSVDMASVEGSLVIFPSFLRHAALPYTGTRDRIVVAFNTRTIRAE